MDIVKFYISMAAVYIWRRAMWFRGFHSNADWLWTVLCVQCWQRNQRDCPTYRLEIHNSLLTTSALEVSSLCQLQIHVYTYGNDLSCLYKIWVVSSHQCHLWSHLILTSDAYNYTYFLKKTLLWKKLGRQSEVRGPKKVRGLGQMSGLPPSKTATGWCNILN